MKIVAWSGFDATGEAGMVIEYDNPKDETHRFACFTLRDQADERSLEFSGNVWRFLRFCVGWEEFNESDEVREQVMARIHHHLKAVGWDEEDSPATL